MKRVFFICLLFFLTFNSSIFAQDSLVSILQSEMEREMTILKTQEIPVYYISYRVEDSKNTSINTTMGALIDVTETQLRLLTVCVRVGSEIFDNYHQLRDNTTNSGYSLVDLPLDNNEKAIKQALWNATNDAYQQAITDYTKVKMNVAVKVKEEDKSPDFTLKQGTLFTDTSTLEYSIDNEKWITSLKKYSKVFKTDTSIINALSTLSVTSTKKYFVSSEGDQIIQNHNTSEIGITAIIKAEDGMDIPLVKTYQADFAYHLPSENKIMEDVTWMYKTLQKLKQAPIAEPYTGPAILSGRSAAVFFHEIFGHRIEGQRMKNESDAQTFRRKVNEQVLPTHLNVYCNPLLKTYNNQSLNGYYKYDDQGVKSHKVTVVENGYLKNFLMSRTPINGFTESNGHGRASAGFQPISRQSNLLIETTKPYTTEQLRQELITQIKDQKKLYGYYFEDVIGGFTTTERYMPNAFNVFPIVVYRIYADGRPDELVRGVDLVGTPLSMFSQIDKAGDKNDIFNGFCGAESGSIPVSAICPMLLVKNIETQKNAKSQDNFILARPFVKE